MKNDSQKTILAGRDDSELVVLSRDGDNLAAEELLKRYIPLVSSRASVFTASGFEYDDMFQEGMIGLYGAIGSFDETVGSPFSAFARLCVDRMMVAVLRASSRKRRIPKSQISRLDEGILNRPDGEGVDPEAVVIAKEEFDRFRRKASNELSSFEYSVLTAFISGCSYNTISDKLGVSVQSVDNALQRIRRKLKG